jgi:hypothetical protein
MKGSLAILLPCLLALSYGHLVHAQGDFSFNDLTNAIPYADSCEQVGSLSDMCKREFRQAVTGSDQDPFCTGNCFTSVLAAYRSCDAALANPVAQLIGRGE